MCVGKLQGICAFSVSFSIYLLFKQISRCIRFCYSMNCRPCSVANKHKHRKLKNKLRLSSNKTHTHTPKLEGSISELSIPMVFATLLTNYFDNFLRESSLAISHSAYCAVASECGRKLSVSLCYFVCGRPDSISTTINKRFVFTVPSVN